MRTYCLEGVCWHWACGYRLITGLGVGIVSGVEIVSPKDGGPASYSFFGIKPQSRTLYIRVVIVEDVCTNLGKRYTSYAAIMVLIY